MEVFEMFIYDKCNEIWIVDLQKWTNHQQHQHKSIHLFISFNHIFKDIDENSKQILLPYTVHILTILAYLYSTSTETISRSIAFLQIISTADIRLQGQGLRSSHQFLKLFSLDFSTTGPKHYLEKSLKGEKIACLLLMLSCNSAKLAENLNSFFMQTFSLIR